MTKSIKELLQKTHQRLSGHEGLDQTISANTSKIAQNLERINGISSSLSSMLQRADNTRNFEQYDESKTYNVGDLVEYSGKLYRCVQTTGTFSEKFNEFFFSDVQTMNRVQELQNTVAAGKVITKKIKFTDILVPNTDDFITMVTVNGETGYYIKVYGSYTDQNKGNTSVQSYVNLRIYKDDDNVYLPRYQDDTGYGKLITASLKPYPKDTGYVAWEQSLHGGTVDKTHEYLMNDYENNPDQILVNYRQNKSPVYGDSSPSWLYLLFKGSVYDWYDNLYRASFSTVQTMDNLPYTEYFIPVDMVKGKIKKIVMEGYSASIHHGVGYEIYEYNDGEIGKLIASAYDGKFGVDDKTNKQLEVSTIETEE